MRVSSDTIKQGCTKPLCYDNDKFFIPRALSNSASMLPAFLRKKKAIVTVPGPMQKSLAYCYLAHQRKQNLKRRLKDYNIEYNLRKLYNIEYPVTTRHLNFIRYDLHQTLNIYTIDDEAGHERRCIYFNNPRAGERTPNVLFYKGRFYLIRNFNKFAGGNIKSRRRRYYCERCLAPLTTLDKWHAHQPACEHQVVFALRIDGKTPVEVESLPEECEPADVALTKDLKGKGMMSAIELAFGKFVPNFDDRCENEDDMEESGAIEEDIVPPTKMEEDDGPGTLRKEEDEHTAANENAYARSKKMEDDNDRDEKTDDANDRCRKMGEHDKQASISSKSESLSNMQDKHVRLQILLALQQKRKEARNQKADEMPTQEGRSKTEGDDDTGRKMEEHEQQVTNNEHDSKVQKEPRTELWPEVAGMQVNTEFRHDASKMEHHKIPSKDVDTMQSDKETLQDVASIHADMEGDGNYQFTCIKKEPMESVKDKLPTQCQHVGKVQKGKVDVLPYKEPAKKLQHKANNSSFKAPVSSVQNDLNRLKFLKEQCMRRQQARKEAEGEKLLNELYLKRVDERNWEADAAKTQKDPTKTDEQKTPGDANKPEALKKELGSSMLCRQAEEELEEGEIVD